MGRRSKGTLPQVRLHASSGQARVRIKGTEIWLGRYGSPEAQRRYDQLILQLVEERLGGPPLSLSPEVSAETEASEMAAASSPTRSPAMQPTRVPEAVAAAPQQDDHGLTVAEVCWQFFCYANRHYRDPSGKPTSTLGNMKAAIRALRRFDDVSAESFGPLMLESLMYQLVEEPVDDGPVSVKGKSRTRHGVNRIIKSVRFIFNWAASRELVPPSVPDALAKLQLLKRGRTTAPEGQRVQPVADAVLEATLPHLPDMVRDMALIQRYAGCRPGEVCAMRRSEIETDRATWRWKPGAHKNAWREQERVIFLGPKAQAILRPYLERNVADDYCFVAARAEVQRNAKRRAERKSPMTPSHRERRRKAAAKKPQLSHFTVAAYRRAITRACETAGMEAWSPNQLRHAAAHEAREHGGLDAAQARLGHATARTTEIYAGLNQQKAAQIAEKLG